MDSRDEKGRFSEGWKGGPGRPPKEQSLTEILRQKVDPDDIAEKLIEMASDNDLGALKYIYDRVDGKPTETRRISGDDEHPLSIAVQVVRPENE